MDAVAPGLVVCVCLDDIKARQSIINMIVLNTTTMMITTSVEVFPYDPLRPKSGETKRDEGSLVVILVNGAAAVGDCVVMLIPAVVVRISFLKF